MGIVDAGGMATGRARAQVSGGFTWRPPTHESGVVVVSGPRDEVLGASGAGAMAMAATFWLGVVAMTLLSFHYPYAGRARQQHAPAAGRPVFVAQPAVAGSEPPWDSAIIAPAVQPTPLAPVASTAKAAAEAPVEHARPRRSAPGSAPSARPAPAPRDANANANAKSAQFEDEESALAVDTLTRSRLERSF
jgi:hypothetical protein